MLKTISRLSIRFKIVSSSIITLLLICIFIFIYYPYNEKKVLNRTMHKETHNLAEMVALGVGVGMGTSNFDLITEAIQWAKKDPDLIYILAIDENKEVFASYNPSNLDYNFDLLLTGKDIIEYKEKEFHIEKVPIMYQNKDFGTIIMVSSLDEYYKLINQRSLITLLVSFSILVFGIILSIIFTKTITNPLVNLQQAAKKIADGNYNINIENLSDNEVGVLGRNINVMAVKINELINQLENEINETKKAHKALQESENRNRMLIELLPVGIVIHSEGEIIFANPSAAKIVGSKESSELIGKSILEFVHHDYRALATRRIMKALSENEPIPTSEGKLIKYDDTIIFVEESALPFPFAGKYAVLTIFNDITERKLAEDVIRQKNTELAELNSSKDRFFSIIAHDLRNPIGTLIMTSKMLSEDWKKVDESEKLYFLEQIYLNSKSLLQLLDNLLTWAMSQSHSLELKRINFDLFDTVSNCIGILNTTAENKGIELISNVPHDINVFADSNMITTVIRNLISNAIKFTNQDGKITIKCEDYGENDNYLVVSITDTGVGMTKEVLNKLFRVDVRQSSPGTKDEKGTGLGLLICKDFVEKNKGKIWVESELGKGSTFSFTVLKHELSNQTQS